MKYGEVSESDAERRVRPRVTVAVQFAMYSLSHRLLLRARTLDLSTHGALLHGICPARVGEPVSLEIGRGPARNPLTLKAQVVRFCEPNATRGHHGVAVRFADVGALDETVLRSIIEEARA